MRLSPAAVLNTENSCGFTKPGGSTPCPQGNHTIMMGFCALAWGEDEQTESLWVRIKVQTSKGDMVGVCCFDQEEELGEASTGTLKDPQRHRKGSLWGTLTILTSVGKTIQQSTVQEVPGKP